VTGEKRPLSPQKAGVSYRHARFDQHGRITNQDSDFDQLAMMDSGTQRVTILRPGLHWDVTSFDLQRDGRFIAYIVNENGSDTLHLMDTETREERPLPKPIRQHRRLTVPSEWPRFGTHHRIGAHAVGCLLDRYTDRQARTLDGKRNRRPGCHAVLRARADPVEVFRRAYHFRIPLPSAQAVHRSTRSGPART